MKKSKKAEEIPKKKEFFLKVAQVALPAFALLSMGFTNPATTNSVSDSKQNKKEIINKSDVSKTAQNSNVSNYDCEGSCSGYCTGCSGCSGSCTGCEGGCHGCSGCGGNCTGSCTGCAGTQ